MLLTTVLGTAANAQHDQKLEVVATFGKSQPIGVSVSKSNRVFVSFPRREPYRFGLTEIREDLRFPFPDERWNTGQDPELSFVNVQDLFVDQNEQLWVLDSKPASSGSIFGEQQDATDGQFKLVQIDLKQDTVRNVFQFADLDKAVSGLNDVRVDTEKDLAYLSDPGQAAIVILDLTTGKSRKVLGKSSFTRADSSVILSYGDRDMVDDNGNPFRSHVNGIALTKDNKWFYFKPINATHLYRIQTRYLQDTSLTDTQLQEQVEDMGEVGVTHGLVADKNGNIYLTTSMDYSVKRLTPDGKIETVVRDSRLLWPDSLGVGEDGYLYFSCAQMQLLPQWNGGQHQLQYPFAVYRVKVL